MTNHDECNTKTVLKDDHQHPYENLFLIPFILILIFALIEFAGGIWTKSLALLGDAWHMLSDVFALGFAMYATHRTAQARAENRQSRSELIASTLNALLMLVVVAWIMIEALDRLHFPEAVSGGYVMAIALLGLLVNLIVAKRLHQGHGHKSHDDLNHRAAFLHVMGDVLGSVAALVAGAVVYYTGWLAIDPILSIFISVLLFVGTLSLMKDILKSIKNQSIKCTHDAHDH